MRKLWQGSHRTKTPATRPIRARYDAAQTTDENKRHWEAADALSAKAANSPGVRKLLRERSRYESQNNSYARGIVQTWSNDLIGTGPRLQIQLDSKETNRAIEAAWNLWARSVGLAEKLRTAKQAKTTDGEVFGVFTTNPLLPTAVKLDVKLIEGDQVTTPFMYFAGERAVDGILFDKAGNPLEYHILKNHPGGDGPFIGLDYDKIPARNVVHWFRADRPGQARGIPEITAALPLFAQLRRYTLAVIAAAETAADFAAVLKTQQGPNVEPDVDGAEDFQELEIVRRMMTQLPAGWDITQFKAEHPSTTHEMFVRSILSEAARCVNMPYAIAANDTSDYSYAGGRLDFQTWALALRVERAHLEAIMLERIFAAWLAEAILIPGLLPAGIPRDPTRIPRCWYWDNRPHVDPSKEAVALKTNLECNGDTLARYYADRGEDWEDALRQRAKELQLIKELGLQPAAAPSPAAAEESDEAEYERPADAGPRNQLIHLVNNIPPAPKAELPPTPPPAEPSPKVCKKRFEWNEQDQLVGMTEVYE